MTIRKVCLLALSAVALTACDKGVAEPAPNPAPAPAPASAPVLTAPVVTAPVVSSVVQAPITLDGEGIRISASAPALIAFGTASAEVVAKVKVALGPDPVTHSNPDCPNGATIDFSWGKSLTVVTRDGKFVGWNSDAAGAKTRSGVEVGSSRQIAEAGEGFETYDSSFDLPAIEVDGVSGFLTADGKKVENLFGGDTCMAS